MMIILSDETDQQMHCGLVNQNKGQVVKAGISVEVTNVAVCLTFC